MTHVSYAEMEQIPTFPNHFPFSGVPFFMKKISFLLPVLIASLAACTNDKMEVATPKPPVSTCDTANVTYTNTIRPLTNLHCAISGCHTSSDQAGGYDLSAYAGLKAIADDANLLGSIRHETGYSSMPQNASKLDDCTIAKYAKWVAAGAPNN